MKNTPVDYQTARRIIDGFGLPDFGKATIREVVADRKSTRLNSSHSRLSRMPSSA